MKSTMIRSLAALVCAFAATAAVAMSTSIAYQGILRDAKGNVLEEKSQAVEFRLYTSASGDEAALWGRSVAILLDSNGLFNVALEDDNGSALENVKYTSLKDALKAARTSTLFVGLTVVGSSGEISPRQQILSVPYASYAQDVDTASGDFTVEGRATIKNLTVTESATFKSDVEFNNSVLMTGDFNLAGNLKVSDANSISGRGTIPVGGIIMWSGSVRDIPNGWVLCNGENNTPNLTGRFIQGSSGYDTGNTGGNSTVRLTVDNLPSHSHEYFGDDQLEGRDSGRTTTKVRDAPGYDAKSELSGSSKVYRSGSTGSGTAINILPPYYVLAYIMRVK